MPIRKWEKSSILKFFTPKIINNKKAGFSGSSIEALGHDDAENFF